MVKKGFNILINLLPQEEAEVIQRQKKFSKIQLLGTGMILLLFFLISITFALTIMQNSRLKKIETNVAQAEEKINLSKNKEVSINLLKNRLSKINQINSLPSKQKELYLLVEKLLPESINVNSLILDKSGDASLSLIAQSSDALDDFFSELINKSTNEGLIASLEVDGISRGRDGIFRSGLKIKGL